MLKTHKYFYVKRLSLKQLEELTSKGFLVLFNKTKGDVALVVAPARHAKALERFEASLLNKTKESV